MSTQEDGPGTDLLPAGEPQRTAQRLASEEIVVSAPLSLAGSAARIWKITRASDETAYKIALTVCAVTAIALAWTFIVAWYIVFGIFLVPYRLIRRGSRKRKRDALQHREQLDAIQSLQHPRQ